MFGLGEKEMSIILTSVMDAVPELNVTYNVTLGMPTGGASLNESFKVAMVTILENDYPYGVFEIVTANGLVVEHMVVHLMSSVMSCNFS